MKKTLREDLKSRLPDVQRLWVRLPATLLIIPFVFIVAVIGHLFEAVEMTAKFFYECWTGEEDNNP